jgi:hypothetical protein
LKLRELGNSSRVLFESVYESAPPHVKKGIIRSLRLTESSLYCSFFFSC